MARKKLRFIQVRVGIATSNLTHTPVTSQRGWGQWAGIDPGLSLWWVCTFRLSRYTAGGVSSRRDWIRSDRDVPDPLWVIAPHTVCKLLFLHAYKTTPFLFYCLYLCAMCPLRAGRVWEMLNAKCVLKVINLCLIVSRGRWYAEFQQHHQSFTHLVPSHQYPFAQSRGTWATISAFLSKLNFGGVEWTFKKMDDSPVESARRDTFVNELPLSSKVHRAVQLQRKKQKVSLVSKTNALLHFSPARN